MTDIVFSFDTEDFTSSRTADAIYREAKILEVQYTFAYTDFVFHFTRLYIS